MRSFIQGLQPNIQSYVTLAWPKSFQEAESLARMEELVDNNQPMSETQTLLTQMQVMLQKFTMQPAFENSKTIVVIEPNQLHLLDELAMQVNHLQNQNQPHNWRKLRGTFYRALTREGKQMARLRTRFLRSKFRGKSHLLYDARRSGTFLDIPGELAECVQKKKKKKVWV